MKFLHYSAAIVASHELVKKLIIANTSSWGFVFNSLDDLKGDFLDYLSEKMGHPRVYSVGSPAFVW